jgi:hypothetical protein
MVPYYGGHFCKQFIRGKPIRWGFKFWVGATRLGYIVWFEPYQGQSGEIPSEYKKLGLGKYETPNEELISISPLILNKFWSTNGMITAL